MFYKDEEITLFNDDCLKILKDIENNSVDSIISDPPAGIEFCGNKWDDDKGGRDNWIAWLEEIMIEALRVIKPGGHILIWSLPKTGHWTATAIENAGFGIVDKIHHAFGSGMPKSLNISKQIDKFNSEDAKEWEGWGTGLKPSIEEWILARKPIDEKNIALNVLRYGTGAINIDASRIDYASAYDAKHQSDIARGQDNATNGKFFGGKGKSVASTHNPTGRFPANFVMSHSFDCIKDEDGNWDCADDCPVRMLEEQSGICKSGKMKAGTPRKNKSGFTGDMSESTLNETYGDEGTAARFFNVFEISEDDFMPFFYCAKPSTKEKNAGLKVSRFKSETGEVEEGKNPHVTVKSLMLMRYLCRLITPPNGTVLDMFMGSGSTGAAAMQCGFKFIGIDMEELYCDTAKKRILYWKNEV